MAPAPLQNDWASFLGEERKWIAKRHGGKARPPKDITGLALSGGGIRSATFCVGFLQTLSARGLIPRIDYMSTVSGGSYAGSFFGSLFVDSRWRGDGTPVAGVPAFSPVHPLQSPLGERAVRRLRDMGRYLTPSGTSDAFYGGAIVARNWVAVQFVIGTTALLLFWAMHLTDRMVSGWAGRWGATVPDLPLLTPTLGVATLILLGAAIAGGTAYWLTRRDVIPVRRAVRVATNSIFWTCVLLLLYTLSPWLPWHPFGAWVPPANGAVLYVAFITAQALVLILAMEWWHGRVELTARATPGTITMQSRIAAEDKVRSALSRWMAKAITLTLACAALGFIDWLGHRLVDSVRLPSLAALANGLSWQAVKDAWPVLVTVVPPLASFAASRMLKSRQPPTDPGDADTRRSWAPLMMVLAGAGTLALWLVVWSAVATAVAARLEAAQAWRPIEQPLLMVLLVLALLWLGQAVSFSFINLSSLSTFYAARLRRAYIGASSYGLPGTSVRVDDPQDTIGVANYYEGSIAGGAPLHLINVTIAETVADQSNLVARDRKGKPMHVSPAGLAWEGPEPGTVCVRLRGRGEQGEDLPLANWVAISGAAVSAAIGAGTSLGTSILATMANVRLGYWWRQRVRGGLLGLLPENLRDTVQNYLFLELRGKFTGAARSRWYLTDGGHFDNTGVYPLLQRQVPFIVACDNGADPDYRMEDVMRLIGRARTDLGAQITFLDEAELAALLGKRSPIAGALGTLAALQRRGSPAEPGGPIAALATIVYRAQPEGSTRGMLLLVKPRLAYTEPPELIAYRNRAGGFPQQATGDQFFDEEQWEAYRRLGEIAGERLFPEARPAGMTGWLPSDALGQVLPCAPSENLRQRLARLLGGSKPTGSAA